MGKSFYIILANEKHDHLKEQQLVVAHFEVGVRVIRLLLFK